MAYTTLVATATTPNFTGNSTATLAPTSVTSGAGNGVAITNDGSTALLVIVGATPTTLTVKVGGTIVGLSPTNPTVALSASTQYIVGPFSSSLNQPGTSTVQIDFSSSATVTVGAIKFGGVY